MTERTANWQGMNWCAKPKRLGIYIRDGMCCAYCGAGVEDGAQLSLDHIKPVSKGGNNEPTNLVTTCKPCNDSRGNRSVKVFAQAVAAYRGVPVAEILKHIKATSKKPIDREGAKALLSSRGCWADAVKAAASGGKNV